MNRKLKALSLAVLALAVMAVSASAAMAGDFHSEASPTTIKGSQVGEDKFTVNAGTVTCQEANYAGSQSGVTSTTVSVVPSYTECKAFGFVNTTIDVNGCEYVFSGDNNNVKIVCGANPITVTAFNCWVTVASQETTGGITYTNTGSGSSRDVDVGVNITGLTYTQHSKSFPGCSSGTRTDGKYTGAATVQGLNSEGKQVGVWRE